MAIIYEFKRPSNHQIELGLSEDLFKVQTKCWQERVEECSFSLGPDPFFSKEEYQHFLHRLVAFLKPFQQTKKLDFYIVPALISERDCENWKLVADIITIEISPYRFTDAESYGEYTTYFTARLGEFMELAING